MNGWRLVLKDESRRSFAAHFSQAETNQTKRGGLPPLHGGDWIKEITPKSKKNIQVQEISGQIRWGPKTRVPMGPPEKVAVWKGIPRLFQGNLGW